MSQVPHPALVEGNTAIVTGGASGIGLATAKRLVSMGLRVCIADVDEESLAKAAAEIDEGDRLLAHPTDVSDPASVDRLAIAVEDRFGPISVAMNNAGTIGGGDALMERTLGSRNADSIEEYGNNPETTSPYRLARVSPRRVRSASKRAPSIDARASISRLPAAPWTNLILGRNSSVLPLPTWSRY